MAFSHATAKRLPLGPSSSEMFYCSQVYPRTGFVQCGLSVVILSVDGHWKHARAVEQMLYDTCRIVRIIRVVIVIVIVKCGVKTGASPAASDIYISAGVGQMLHCIKLPPTTAASDVKGCVTIIILSIHQ